MSKVVIAGDASGTGTFTISAPNGNTDRTLVLPDEAGTVLTSAGVPASAMPAGSVLQVVSAQRDSNEVYTGSSTAITTNFSATITPSSTSSKILIIGALNTRADGGDTNFGAYDLYRNGSVIFTNIAGFSGNSVNFKLSAVTLDSPSSTSAQTYTWYIKSAGSGHDVRFNPTPVGALYASSQMILMEIAA